MEEQEGDVPSDIQRKKRFDFLFEWFETVDFGVRSLVNDMRCKCLNQETKHKNQATKTDVASVEDKTTNKKVERH